MKQQFSGLYQYSPPAGCQGYAGRFAVEEFGAQLRNWVKPRQLGRVTGAGAGFNLPNSDTRAPDVSFVKAERLRRSPRSFAELAPDLMVEVKSPTDSLKGLRTKSVFMSRIRCIKHFC